MKPVDLYRLAVKSRNVNFMSEVMVQLSANPENNELVESLHRTIELTQTGNDAADRVRVICDAGRNG